MWRLFLLPWAPFQITGRVTTAAGALHLLRCKLQPDATGSSRWTLVTILSAGMSRRSGTFLFSAHFSQAKIRFQSFFMLMTNQPFDLASSYSAWVKVPTLVSGSPWAGP